MDKLGPTGLRVGHRLNELRRARNYTLADLETRLTTVGRPILLSALSKIEKGQRRVDVDDLVALALALEVSPNSLLLPDPMGTTEAVALSPSMTLYSPSVWEWAIRDRPMSSRIRDGIAVLGSPSGRWEQWITWHLEKAGHQVRMVSFDTTSDVDVDRYVGEVAEPACTITVVPGQHFEAIWQWLPLRMTFARGQATLLPVLVETLELGHQRLADLGVEAIHLNDRTEEQARVALLDALSQLGIPTRPFIKSPPPFPRSTKYGVTTQDSVHRSILAVDIAEYTDRSSTAKMELRAAMYNMVESALTASGFTANARDPMTDRGDGILVLIRPNDHIRKGALLDTVAPILASSLADYNRGHPENQFKLRVAVHAGEVHFDNRGVFGESLDVTFRLLDAPEVKRRLTKTKAPMVLVVSDEVYRTVLPSVDEGIDPKAGTSVVITANKVSHQGWATPVDDAGHAIPRLPRF